MTVFEQLKDVAPWVAIVISIATFIYASISNRKLRKQQSTINARIIESGDKELAASKKADVRVDADYHKGNSDGHIVISNRGPSVARNVRLSQTDDKSLIQANEYEKMPHPQLLSGESVRLRYSITAGTGGSHQFTVYWDDDSQSDNELARSLEVLS
jgi:hypothetical protein